MAVAQPAPFAVTDSKPLAVPIGGVEFQRDVQIAGARSFAADCTPRGFSLFVFMR